MSKHKKLKRKVAELETQMDRMFGIVSAMAANMQQLSRALEAMPHQFGEAFQDRLSTHTALIERQEAAREGRLTSH